MLWSAPPIGRSESDACANADRRSGADGKVRPQEWKRSRRELGESGNRGIGFAARYEMIYGRTPFRGHSLKETFDAIRDNVTSPLTSPLCADDRTVANAMPCPGCGVRVPR